MPNVDVSEGLTSVPSAAMGLSGVVRWTREHPFIDIFKTTVPWVGNSDAGWNSMPFDQMEAGGYLDEDGWLTEMPPGLNAVATTLLSDLPEENVSMAGRYHLRYEGEGTVELRGPNGLLDIVSQENGEIIFDFTPGDGILIFEIEDTDPNGNGNYIRDITIVKEDYLDLHEAGAIFNPVWIDLIEDLGAVRFMDWMRTNESLQSEWADRPQVGDTTYATDNGVPLEIMVELANQIGSDPWFNIPFHATDEYVREFAAYVRDNLDPDLKAQFEFSNEVWNNNFDQTGDAHDAGRELWGTEYGNYPGRYYYGYRSAEVMDIIKDEFGEEAGRVDGVLAVHTATPSRFEHIMTGAERYASENSANVDALFESVAVTWYFGGGFKHDESYNQIMEWASVSLDHALDNVFEQLQNGSLMDVSYTTVSDTTDNFAEWGQIAQQYGLNLISYEGGPHIVGNPSNRNDPEFVEVLTAVNRDPRMLEIYNEVYSAWVDAGGGLFNAFQDIKRDGNSGSWGHLTHLDDEDARWDAIMAINETPNENMPERDVSDFDHGVTLLGGNDDELLVGTLEEDFLVGAGGNDELHGGNKEDGLHGGDGDDKLFGGDGDDNLIGGDGNDWLDGGSGIDTVLGGAGNDTIVFDAEDDFSNVDGGAGIDILRINGGELPTIDLAAHGLEGADYVITDNGDADWSELTDHYDVNWVRTSQDGTFDDGRTWHTEWDVSDSFDWSEFTEIFDAAGNFLERIEVSDDAEANQAPVDITLSGGDVDENANGGTVVATLSAVDPDAGDSFSFAITNDPSGFFVIVGNEVRLADGADVDFETAQSHQITVEVTDAGGLSYSEAVTVTVNDQTENSAPTDIVVGGGSVDENADGGTIVATLSAVDPDAGDSFSYAITNDASGLFEIVGNEVRLVDGAQVDFESAQSFDIAVEVTDAAGASHAEVITLSVNDLNDETPTDIVVDGGAMDENAPGGTLVATLSAVDADAADSFSFVITDDPTGMCEMVGNEIRLIDGAQVDFEQAPSVDIVVEVTDAGGNSYSEVVTLTVNDLMDETPSEIVVGGGEVEENAEGGTVVATLSAVDADAGDSFTYAITDDTSGLFEIVGNEVRVASGAVIDFEAAQSHAITIEVTDAGGNSHSELITLEVGDLNDETPTDIVVGGGAVDENAEAGTVVATLSSVDADAGDSFSYAIVNDASGLFEIVGNEVRVVSGAVIDFEAAGSHEITVEVTDGGFNSYAEVVTIAVNDLDDDPAIITLEGTADDDVLLGTSADELVLGEGGNDCSTAVPALTRSMAAMVTTSLSMTQPIILPVSMEARVTTP